MLAHGHRSREADLADDWRSNKMPAHHVRYAVDELRYIARDTAVDHALHDGAGACGCFFGWFGDDRTSCRKCCCHFLAHQIDREVPRRKRGDWPNWLLQHQSPLSGRSDKHAAVAALGLLAEIVELRGARENFSARFGKWLALLSIRI